MSRKLKFQPGDLIVSNTPWGSKDYIYKVERHDAYGDYICTLEIILKQNPYDIDRIGDRSYRSSYCYEKWVSPVDDDLIWE